MTRSLRDRLLEKTIPEPNSGCFLWEGAIRPNGYGSINVTTAKGEYSNASVHRVAYEIFRGAIPAGLTIDHLCRTRTCVNVDHMEVVTRAENTKRGGGSQASGAINLAKTHCPAGHAYSGDNLYVNPKGRRECRICRKARVEDFKARRAAA